MRRIRTDADQVLSRIEEIWSEDTIGLKYLNTLYSFSENLRHEMINDVDGRKVTISEGQGVALLEPRLNANRLSRISFEVRSIG